MPFWMAPNGTPPVEETPWLELEPGPDLPSAIDAIVEPDDVVEPGAAEARAPAAASFRTRWYLRPRLAVTALEDRWHPDLGITAGHQWWKFTDAVIAPAGETQVTATMPLGEPGYDVSLDAVGGVWAFDRIGVLVGPTLEADRIRWTDAYTDHAGGLGPSARLALQLGLLTPWGDVAPQWIVGGDRPPLADAPWDSFRTRAGVIFGRRFQLRLDGSHTATGSGEVWEASAGVHLQIGG
jgi:hypothetical protein